MKDSSAQGTAHQHVLAGHYTLEDIASPVGIIVQQLRDYLAQFEVFGLAVRGELGSGKTTMVRHILYGLGLDSQVAVTSPTYTYSCSYPTHYGLVVHMDIHRLGSSHLDEMNLLTAAADEPVVGYIIEWPELMGAELLRMLRSQLSSTVVFELSLTYEGAVDHNHQPQIHYANQHTSSTDQFSHQRIKMSPTYSGMNSKIRYVEFGTRTLTDPTI